MGQWIIVFSDKGMNFFEISHLQKTKLQFSKCIKPILKFGSSFFFSLPKCENVHLKLLNLKMPFPTPYIF